MTIDTLLPDELRRRLDELSYRDARRLGSRLDEALRRPADRRAEALAAVAAAVDAAAATVSARRAAMPAVTYPADLPITARRDDLMAAIRDHQVVVVAGETGSGKSTQLPKLCLDLGRGVRGLIGHTQPRRVAARTVAERVASELGTELGGAVGYTVRFTDRVSDATLLKVMTDGILLAETQRDRELGRYDTIIIDEAHERSLNIDFLLGYLHQLLPRRPDLKLVITSATIDTARFSEHFGAAPVIEVSGRTYPVEVRYRPYGAEPDDERDQVTAIVDAVDELAAEGPGDVLVFVSGEREIHDAADALRRRTGPRTDVEVLPLYARLSAAEQHRVFEPHRNRRVVLATNVAETSLTVPGVRYVVDAGTARISRYSRRLKVQRLPIEPVSQASANQRAGRCGRVAPGVCIRLYAEDDYASRPEFTEPEILRTNLASVILQMATLGLGDVASFPFVEPPDARSVADGVALLEELGALRPGDEPLQRRLTPLGRRLAQLPVDPRLGRMVLEADKLGCARDVMVIAAAMSIQDPRERPEAHRQAAEESHRRFATDGSDFLAYVRLWDHLREQQRALSGNQFRKLCRTEFLNYLRVREWQDLFSQLRHVTSGLGIRLADQQAHPDHVHRALLSGLLSQIGLREGTERDFRGARGARFAIANGSVIARKPPRWVMAGELVETNRLWARTAAPIQPEWAERAAPHLVKRTYGDPRWDARRGAAVVSERVTLFGLPVVTSRPVDLARLDAAAARQLLVRHALVDPATAVAHLPFVAANRAVLEEVRALQERWRGRGVHVDDEALVAFYDGRVPADVASVRQLESWWKRERRDRPGVLALTRDALLSSAALGSSASDFPDAWHQGDLELALTYRFEPGEPGDGVIVHVPVALLQHVRAEGFDWQVPGFRDELVEALARSLPKAVRRQLVPVADTARAIVRRLVPGEGNLADVLAYELGREAGLPLSAADLRPDLVPDHLRMTFSVDDERGRPLALGKDLAELQERFRARTRVAVARATDTAERTGLTAWGDLGTLPRTVDTTVAGHTVHGYPSLVDEGTTAGVRVLTSEGAQRLAMRAGTVRLLQLTVAAPRKLTEQVFGNDVRMALLRLGHGTGPAELHADVVLAALDAVVDAAGGPAWDADGFAALADEARRRLPDLVHRTARAAAKVVIAAGGVRARLDALVAPAVQPAVADVTSQLTRLAGPGFVRAAGVDRLGHVARYVEGMARRLDRVGADPQRDLKAMRTVHALEDAVADALARVPAERRTPAHGEIVWLLEELRVSLFAQQLGTAQPVSEQRIRREIQALAKA